MYPARTMNSVEGSPWLSASSSQMKNANPIAAGHCPRRSGYSDGSHGVMPEPAHDPRPDVVQRRERVDPVPDREEQRGNERDADPPVHPQEERRHVGRAGTAGDALGHDPRPGEQADRAQPIAEPGGRQSGWPLLGGQLDADVTQDDERERQGDRDGRAGQVDRERQPAGIRGIQLVAERDAGQQDRERDAPDRGAGEDETADHGWAGRRRMNRYPPRTATITTAAMIGKSTSLVPAALAGGVASPSVGLGATTPTQSAARTRRAVPRPASSGSAAPTAALMAAA